MTDEELKKAIEKLRGQGCDDSVYEAKESSSSLSKDVWETVSAFANTAGGILILGLSEKAGFVPVEKFEIDKVRSQFIEGMGDGGTKSRLTNPPQYTIERFMFEGSPLLVISIDELDVSYKPCYITDRGVQGGSYKRVDDADIPLSANEIYSLRSAHTPSFADRGVVDGALISDLDESICVQSFAKAQQVAPRSMRDAETYEERLRRLNFIDSEGRVIKAGLLAAGVYPQQFYSKLHIDVAVHAGMQKSEVGGLRFLDRSICEGTLGEMISDAVAAIAKNLRFGSVVKGVERVDTLEIPEEVLREVIANALIHREYDPRFDGEAVAVDIFPDRIEVVNPGGLWGKSRSDLADGRSCCRNATLMRLMSIVPLPEGAGSPAEGNGSGIPLMKSMLVANGLDEPIFCPSIDHFKVILRRPAAGRIVEAKTEVFQGDVLALLDKYGELSAKEIVERSGLSINQVRNRVRALLADDSIVATAPPTSRKRKYRLKR